MNFLLLLSSSAHSPVARRALRFAEAALQSGHRIERIFLYQDAVHLASKLLVAPQDEIKIAQQWQALILEHRIDAVVCIATALRRGVLDGSEAQRYELDASNLAEGYVLSGLGQLHEAMQQTDRLIHFRGQA